MPAPREPVVPQEYTQLFHTYYPQTVRYILALLTRRGHPPDQGLAEELAQEAFLLLWEKRAEAANPVGWLYTTAANLVWNQLRSHRRWSARLAQVEPEYLEALPGPPPSDDLLDLEGTVAPEELALLKRVYLEGFTYEEAARQLGITKTALSKRICRIKEKCRRSLSADGTSPPSPEQKTSKGGTKP